VIDPPNENDEELVWTVYEGEDEPEPYRDQQGRLLPCCEFMFDRWGWQKRR
jgi:hypothetical protein